MYLIKEDENRDKINPSIPVFHFEQVDLLNYNASYLKYYFIYITINSIHKVTYQ
jgi:hypothetical protein